MPDYKDIRRLAAQVRSHIRELSPEDARRRVADGALLIDVRDDEELLLNPPLAGALHLSRGRLEYLITDAVERRDEPIIIYCGGGNRGALATASLVLLGYTNVHNVRGGLHAWRAGLRQHWSDGPRSARYGAREQHAQG